jgi:hypothetical protein
MTARAHWEIRSASLATPFGRDFAMRAFKLTENELAALVGRISRGPRKGMLRGCIVWAKTTSGGWVKTGAYDWDAQRGNGFVAPKGLVFGHGLYANACLAPVKGYDLTANRGDAEVRALRDAVLGIGQREPVQSVPEAALKRPRMRGNAACRLFINLDAFVQLASDPAWLDTMDDYVTTDLPH